jgi:hypothetical protein
MYETPQQSRKTIRSTKKICRDDQDQKTYLDVNNGTDDLSHFSNAHQGSSRAAVMAGCPCEIAVIHRDRRKIV